MDDQRFHGTKVIVFLGIIQLFLGCASVNIPNATEAGYSLEDDERRLCKRAEEYIEIIDKTDSVYEDAAFETYLNNLANGLLPQEAKNNGIVISIKVLKDPALNAFALPNGRIYVHTGIIAAAENEEQLAGLLAHEITHVLNRHAIKQMRSLTNKSALFSVVGIPIAIAGGNLGSILTQLATISSIFGYSQQL